MKHFLFIYLCLLTVSCHLAVQEDCVLEIKNPTCERLQHAIGIEMPQPRLSWHLEAACSNQKQGAYRILVASTKQKLEENEADVWDSGKVISANSLNIGYKGANLETAKTYYWKLKVWNAHARESAWSSVQQWTMGLLREEDKQAAWIGLDLSIDAASQEQKEAAHYMASTFQTQNNKVVHKAIAFVSGLGLFDLYLNGQLISDHRLNPSNTNYFKRAMYVGFDITKNITGGENAIGIALGNGKHLLQRKDRRDYALPRAWCQIHLEYKDGSTQIIKSDETWKLTTKGPIRFNSEFDGERYDARMEIDNWALTELNTSDWQSVEVLDDYQAKLTAQLMPPVRVVETRVAKKITKAKNGKFIFDFGQNLTGWGRLEVEGIAGTQVRIRYAELLDSLGNLDTASIRGAKATDVFILKGKGKESFEPRFSYHGFRYAELSGLSLVPDTATLKACVAHNDLKAVGDFVCSNPLLNQIYTNARWSIRSNYQHIPVDCPQRDERYGWLGDRAATAFGELYLYDIQHFYTKWMQDIADEQKASGALPNIAPAHWEVYKDNVTWPATYVQLVGLLYRYYGDALVVAKHYDGMHQWMNYIAEQYSFEEVIYSDQYGDWLVPAKNITEESNKDARLKSASDILATSTYLLVAKEMYAFASLLQKEDDVIFYEEKIKALQSVIKERLLDKSQYAYGNHSPTELLLLLAEEELTPADRSILLENLLGMLQGQFDSKIAFGLVGMRWSMKVLSESGALDFAYQLATNQTYPSWGFMVDQGATTMWESWTGKQDKSQNHVMLIGDLLEWFYVYLAGIRQAEDGIAFDKLELVPYLPEGLDSVQVSYLSPRGEIRSRWKKTGDKFQWKVELPVGTTGELFLPYDQQASLKKQGRFLRLDSLMGKELYAVFELGSGEHSFECSLPKRSAKKIYSAPPEISLQDLVLEKKKAEDYLVTLTTANEQSQIYYTLDGSDPSLKSKQYEQAFAIQAYTIIKAIAKEKDKEPSYVRNSFIDIYDPELNGWNYWYYEKAVEHLPDFDTLVVVDSGRVSLIDLKKLKQRPNFWAFRFEAYLEIPKTGIYSFYLESNDGARIVINEKEVVVNDGIHYNTQRKGRIQLTKGKHRIRLEHFNWWSYNALEVLISGPNLARQRLPVSWVYFKN